MCIPNCNKSMCLKRSEEGTDPEGGKLVTVCFEAVGLSDHVILAVTFRLVKWMYGFYEIHGIIND